MSTQRTIKMYPDTWASMNAERCGQKYQPSNGTEGEIFFESWCRQCARDKAMNSGEDYDECDDNEVCGIIALTFSHNVNDPEYPSEWQYDKQGQPCCTAFVEVGKPIQEPRCEHTVDLFGDEK